MAKTLINADHELDTGVMNEEQMIQLRDGHLNEFMAMVYKKAHELDPIAHMK